MVDVTEVWLRTRGGERRAAAIEVLLKIGGKWRRVLVEKVDVVLPPISHNVHEHVIAMAPYDPVTGP